MKHLLRGVSVVMQSLQTFPMSHIETTLSTKVIMGHMEFNEAFTDKAR